MMLKKMNILFYELVFSTLMGLSPSFSQIPSMEWHKGFGTEQEEHVHEGWQTNDGGYIVTLGFSQSALDVQEINSSLFTPEPKSTLTILYLPSTAVGAQ